MGHGEWHDVRSAVSNHGGEGDESEIGKLRGREVERGRLLHCFIDYCSMNVAYCLLNVLKV